MESALNFRAKSALNQLPIESNPTLSSQFQKNRNEDPSRLSDKYSIAIWTLQAGLIGALN